MDVRIAAATAVARDHGIRVTDPVVLRERSNLLVHLRPAPVVVRIPAQLAAVRPGTAWLAREVAVAGFLAERGARVVRPSAELPARVHERDGLAMTFWTFVAEVPGTLDAAEAGHRLRRCHDLLRDLPAELPRLGALTELERILPEEAATIGPRVRAAIAAAEPLPLQPVHGDAHLGNVLQGPDGPLWTDWEDACLAPRGWDVACLLASKPPFGRRDPALVDDAVAATGEPLDGIEPLVTARRLQVAVWSVVLGRARGDAAMVDAGRSALAG